MFTLFAIVSSLPLEGTASKFFDGIGLVVVFSSVRSLSASCCSSFLILSFIASVSFEWECCWLSLVLAPAFCGGFKRELHNGGCPLFVFA